jgi:hypothetical protein
MSSGKPFHRGEQTAERMPENWRAASAARWQGAPVFSVEHPIGIVFTAPAAGEQKPIFKETV